MPGAGSDPITAANAEIMADQLQEHLAHAASRAAQSLSSGSEVGSSTNKSAQQHDPIISAAQAAKQVFGAHGISLLDDPVVGMVEADAFSRGQPQTTASQDYAASQKAANMAAEGAQSLMAEQSAGAQAEPVSMQPAQSQGDNNMGATAGSVADSTSRVDSERMGIMLNDAIGTDPLPFSDKPLDNLTGSTPASSISSGLGSRHDAMTDVPAVDPPAGPVHLELQASLPVSERPLGLAGLMGGRAVSSEHISSSAAAPGGDDDLHDNSSVTAQVSGGTTGDESVLSDTAASQSRSAAQRDDITVAQFAAKQLDPQKALPVSEEVLSGLVASHPKGSQLGMNADAGLPKLSNLVTAVPGDDVGYDAAAVAASSPGRQVTTAGPSDPALVQPETTASGPTVPYDRDDGVGIGLGLVADVSDLHPAHGLESLTDLRASTTSWQEPASAADASQLGQRLAGTQPADDEDDDELIMHMEDIGDAVTSAHVATAARHLRQHLQVEISATLSDPGGDDQDNFDLTEHIAMAQESETVGVRIPSVVESVAGMVGMVEHAAALGLTSMEALAEQQPSAVLEALRMSSASSPKQSLPKEFLSFASSTGGGDLSNVSTAGSTTGAGSEISPGGSQHGFSEGMPALGVWPSEVLDSEGFGLLQATADFGEQEQSQVEQMLTQPEAVGVDTAMRLGTSDVMPGFTEFLSDAPITSEDVAGAKELLEFDQQGGEYSTSQEQGYVNAALGVLTTDEGEQPPGVAVSPTDADVFSDAMTLGVTLADVVRVGTAPAGSKRLMKAHAKACTAAAAAAGLMQAGESVRSAVDKAEVAIAPADVIDATSAHVVRRHRAGAAVGGSGVDDEVGGQFAERWEESDGSSSASETAVDSSFLEIEELNLSAEAAHLVPVLTSPINRTDSSVPLIASLSRQLSDPASVYSVGQLNPDPSDSPKEVTFHNQAAKTAAAAAGLHYVGMPVGYAAQIAEAATNPALLVDNAGVASASPSKQRAAHHPLWGGEMRTADSNNTPSWSVAEDAAAGLLKGTPLDSQAHYMSTGDPVYDAAMAASVTATMQLAPPTLLPAQQQAVHSATQAAGLETHMADLSTGLPAAAEAMDTGAPVAQDLPMPISDGHAGLMPAADEPTLPYPQSAAGSLNVLLQSPAAAVSDLPPIPVSPPPRPQTPSLEDMTRHTVAANDMRAAQQANISQGSALATAYSPVSPFLDLPFADDTGNTSLTGSDSQLGFEDVPLSGGVGGTGDAVGYVEGVSPTPEPQLVPFDSGNAAEVLQVDNAETGDVGGVGASRDVDLVTEPDGRSPLRPQDMQGTCETLSPGDIRASHMFDPDIIAIASALQADRSSLPTPLQDVAADIMAAGLNTKAEQMSESVAPASESSQGGSQNQGSLADLSSLPEADSAAADALQQPGPALMPAEAEQQGVALGSGVDFVVGDPRAAAEKGAVLMSAGSLADIMQQSVDESGVAGAEQAAAEAAAALLEQVHDASSVDAALGGLVGRPALHGEATFALAPSLDMPESEFALAAVADAALNIGRKAGESTDLTSGSSEPGADASLSSSSGRAADDYDTSFDLLDDEEDLDAPVGDVSLSTPTSPTLQVPRKSSFASGTRPKQAVKFASEVSVVEPPAADDSPSTSSSSSTSNITASPSSQGAAADQQGGSKEQATSRTLTQHAVTSLGPVQPPQTDLSSHSLPANPPAAPPVYPPDPFIDMPLETMLHDISNTLLPNEAPVVPEPTQDMLGHPLAYLQTEIPTVRWPEGGSCMGPNAL